MSVTRDLKHFNFLAAMLQNEELRKEVFRLVVDGKFHKTEQGYVGYENRENGSLRNVLNATLESRKKLDPKKPIVITPTLYKNIHALCREGIKQIDSSIVGGKFTTTGKVYIGIRRLTVDGLMDLCKFAEKYPALQLKVSVQTTSFDVETLRLSPIMARYFLEKMHNNHKGDSETHFAIEVSSDAEVSEQVAEAILKELNQALEVAKSDDEIIQAIINCAYELEHLHAFIDVNLRANIVLMNILLGYYGFPPVSYFDPNYIDGSSKFEFFEIVKEGMLKTLDIITYPGQEHFGFKVSQLGEEEKLRYAKLIELLVANSQDAANINVVDIGALTKRIQLLKAISPSPILIDQAVIQKTEIMNFIKKFDRGQFFKSTHVVSTPPLHKQASALFTPTQSEESRHTKKKLRPALTEEDKEVLNIYTQEISKLKDLHANYVLTDLEFAQKLREFGDPTAELFSDTGTTIISVAETVGVPNQVILMLSVGKVLRN